MPEIPSEKSKARGGKPLKSAVTPEGIDTLFPVNFANMQARNAAMLARANEILTDTAKRVWESEADLFRLDTDQARKNFIPMRAGDDFGTAFGNACSQLHDNAERTISRLRTISDLMRDCEWRLLDLFADNLKAAARRSTA